MKDLKNMAIYVGGATLVIAILLGLAMSGTFSSDIIGIISVFLVVILPVFIALRVAKKEHEQR